jgi:hypothetical protein
MAAMMVFLIFVAGVAGVCAKEQHTVAILPFTVDDQSNKKYLRELIRYTLSSHLKKDEDIRLVPADRVDEALKSIDRKSLSTADLYMLGKKIDTDYVIYGTVIKVGFNSNVYIELVNIDHYRNQYASFAVCHSVDEVVTKISSFATDINSVIGGPEGNSR